MARKEKLSAEFKDSKKTLCSYVCPRNAGRRYSHRDESLHCARKPTKELGCCKSEGENSMLQIRGKSFLNQNFLPGINLSQQHSLGISTSNQLNLFHDESRPCRGPHQHELLERDLLKIRHVLYSSAKEKEPGDFRPEETQYTHQRLHEASPRDRCDRLLPPLLIRRQGSISPQQGDLSTASIRQRAHFLRYLFRLREDRKLL